MIWPGGARFSEAVARIAGAQQQLLHGKPVAAATGEVQAALVVGLPPRAEPSAGLAAVFTLIVGERYERPDRLLDAALERARREGHATRQGIIHAMHAASALARGSLPDAQVEAETGLLLVEQRHFTAPLLVPVGMTVRIERGGLHAGPGRRAR